MMTLVAAMPVMESRRIATATASVTFASEQVMLTVATSADDRIIDLDSRENICIVAPSPRRKSVAGMEPDQSSTASINRKFL